MHQLRDIPVAPRARAKILTSPLEWGGGHLCPPTSALRAAANAALRACIRIHSDGDVIIHLRDAETIVFPISPTDEERGGKG